MHTLSGDIEYTREGDYLTLHTDMGDVMIGPEDLEDLVALATEILEDG